MAVYKKGNNYYIDYYFNGRRKRELIGIDCKLAKLVLAKRKVQIAEGRFLDIKKDTKTKLYEIFDDFLEYSKNSKKSYSRDLILVGHLKKFFDNVVLSEISTGVIEKYRTKRLNIDKVGNATVNRETAFLKATFNLAIRNRKATENPVKFIKKLKEPDGRVRFLSHEEINRLLDTCNQYFRPVVICALTTGMRRNEILDLLWKDVDMDRGLIRITNTKNGRTRNIPMCGMLHRTLKECFGWSDGVYVFCNSNGSKYHSVHSLWENTVREACVDDFRFHDLRHTAASYLVMAGTDLVTVKEILGHRTLEMTLRYAHLSKTHLREAIEVLGVKMDTIWTPKDKTAIVNNLQKAKLSSVE
ncbi:MAG: tyrosine-type recombinase/integrase [Elusimicrobiota bacterium]